MLSPSHPQSVRVPCRIPSSVCDVYLVSLDRRVSGTSSIPTATLLEHALLAQGFLGVSKVAFPRRLQLQNRDSTGANLSNAIKCRCRGRDPGDLSGSAHLNDVLTATREAVKMKVLGGETVLWTPQGGPYWNCRTAFEPAVP